MQPYSYFAEEKRQAWTTRFAPTPSGAMHLGHALACRVAWDLAQFSHGQCLLRWEDLDAQRCRPQHFALMREDLAWLGFDFAPNSCLQSQRHDAYRTALMRLLQLGVVYGCSCSRAELQQAGIVSEMQAPHSSEWQQFQKRLRCDCAKNVATAHALALQQGFTGYNWRLHSARAAELHARLQWQDWRMGQASAETASLPDVLLLRRDGVASYNLAVVVDDAAQGINLVSRGEDLFAVTALQCLLQKLLDLPQPYYYHHRLVLDGQGRRLAKRDAAAGIATLRESGLAASQLWQMLGYDDMPAPLK